MKKIFAFLSLFICFVFAFSGFLSTQSSVIYADNGLNVLAFGDSISAGYAPNVSPYSDTDETEDPTLIEKRNMLQNYFEFCNSNYGTTASKSAYTYNFAKQVDITANIRSYANSGDTSTDLANMLTVDGYQKTLAENGSQVTIQNQSIASAIKSADIVTLCIGANDVLQTAVARINQTIEDGGIAYLLTGFTPEMNEEFSDLIDQNVEAFKSNYTTKILPKLSGKKVFVMTIYNPYKYLSIADRFVGLTEILNKAIEGLDQINNAIRASANKNVIVVDVAKSLDQIAEKYYKDYVNADLSKIDIMSLGAFGSGQIPYYMDPHPTPLGQQTIAKMYFEAYQSDQKVPTSKIVIIALSLGFVAIALSISTYLIVEKIKYRRIKF